MASLLQYGFLHVNFHFCFTSGLLFPQWARHREVNCQNTLYGITLTNPANSNGTKGRSPQSLWSHSALKGSKLLVKVFKLMSLSEMCSWQLILFHIFLLAITHSLLIMYNLEKKKREISFSQKSTNLFVWARVQTGQAGGDTVSGE